MKKIERELLKYYLKEFFKIIKDKHYDWKYNYEDKIVIPEPEKNKELDELIIRLEMNCLLNQSFGFTESKLILKDLIRIVKYDQLKLHKLKQFRMNIYSKPYLYAGESFKLYSFKIKGENEKELIKQLVKKLDKIDFYTYQCKIQLDDNRLQIHVDDKEKIAGGYYVDFEKTEEKIEEDYFLKLRLEEKDEK